MLIIGTFLIIVLMIIVKSYLISKTLPIRYIIKKGWRSLA